MQIKIEQPTKDKAILYPIGRMDVESSPIVRQTILDMVEKSIGTIVVDLSQVEFMDSSGLSALVSGMKALRRIDGRLNICNANAQIRTALRLTMLDRVLPVYDNLDNALNS
jgi:anti-sigma B factor antagonist